MKMVAVIISFFCLASVLNASESDFPSEAIIISRFQDPYHAERVRSTECLGLAHVPLKTLREFLSTNAVAIAAEIWDPERLSDEIAYVNAMSTFLYLRLAKTFGVPIALKEEIAVRPHCLLNSVQYGNVDLVRIQISGGANVNVRGPVGVTPLHLACARGAYKMVQVLVDAGAEVQAITDDTGKTPLHFLCGAHSLKSLEAMNSLLSSASGGSSDGRAKHTAFDPVKALHILILNGANSQMRDAAGKRPYDSVRLDREGRPGESDGSVAFGRMLDSMDGPDSSKAQYREALRRATGEPALPPASTPTAEVAGGAGATTSEGPMESCTIS